MLPGTPILICAMPSLRLQLDEGILLLWRRLWRTLLWCARLAAGSASRSGVVVGRVLRLRAFHPHRDFLAIGVDLVILAKGLEAISDDLEAHGVADGDD